jgi:hypothetical protein
VKSIKHSIPLSEARPTDTKRKRKLDEAQSANSSTNEIPRRPIEAVPVEVDSDEEKATRNEVIVSKPPRKKRRITSDSEGGHVQQPKKSHDVRNGGGRLKPLVTTDGEDEIEPTNGAVVKEHFHEYDEEEERIVEDALSQGYHSEAMNNSNDESRNDEVDSRNGNLDGKKEQTKHKQRANILHLPLEEEEESDEVEVLKKSKTLRLPQEEEEESDEVEVLKEALRQPRPPTQSNASPRVHVRPGKKPGARMVPHPSPSWERRQPVVTAVPTSDSKSLAKTRPVVTTKKTKNSSFVAQSSSNRNLQSRPPLFEPDSDSDRPQWYPKLQQSKKHLRKQRDVTTIHDSDGEVTLSPRARQRLALFDAEVMKKKTRVVEKKRVKEVNGNGEVSTLKRSSSSGNNRPAPSTARPPPRLDSQSYNMDVVPETELENSQEGKLQSSSTAAQNNEIRNDVFPITSAPGPSVIKSLRPVPQIPPSIFHPHLQPPNSSLPDTIIEPSSSHERPPEIESIEQFESPEKARTLYPKAVIVLNKNGPVPEAKKSRLGATENEEVSESEIALHGQEIVEQVEARRRRLSASSGAESSPEMTKKKSVQEVVARAESRRRSERNASQPQESDDEEHQCREEGVENASTSVVPPASGPPALSQDQPPPVDVILQPMNDSFDLNEGMDVGEPEEIDETHDDDGISAGINPELLRQEEEENTQDMMAELKRRQEQSDETRETNPNEGWNFGPPVSAPSTRLVSISGDTGGPNTLRSTEVRHFYCFCLRLSEQM